MSLADRIAAAKARRVAEAAPVSSAAAPPREARRLEEAEAGSCSFCGDPVRWVLIGGQRWPTEPDVLRGTRGRTESAGAKVTLLTADGLAVRCTLDPDGLIEGRRVHRCPETP